MTTQTIRQERGLADTRVAVETEAAGGSGSVRDFLREAAETLRGALAAPLKAALEGPPSKSLQALNEATRRDIGSQGTVYLFQTFTRALQCSRTEISKLSPDLSVTRHASLFQ